jgi:beta-lactamase regulating signal transducer with metallopeptidase domain
LDESLSSDPPPFRPPGAAGPLLPIEASEGFAVPRGNPAQDDSVSSGSVPPARGPSPSSLDWGDAVAWAYVTGGLACLTWLLVGRCLLVWTVRSASPPPRWLQELYEELPRAGKRRPRLVISGRSKRAFSFGVWRPTVVLPQSACRAGSAGLVRHVLLHELAHVDRGDARTHLLFNLAFPLLYFHPLYWHLRGRASLAAELIADDRAAGRRGKESYAEALVALARQQGRRQPVCLGLQGVFRSHSQFFRRIEMLLDREAPLASRCSAGWRVVWPAACVLAVALLAGAMGVPPGEAQEASDNPEPDQAQQAATAADRSATDAAESNQGIDRSRKEQARLLAELRNYQLQAARLAAEKADLEAKLARAAAELKQKVRELEEKLVAAHPGLSALLRDKNDLDTRMAELRAQLKQLTHPDVPEVVIETDGHTLRAHSLHVQADGRMTLAGKPDEAEKHSAQTPAARAAEPAAAAPTPIPTLVETQPERRARQPQTLLDAQSEQRAREPARRRSLRSSYSEAQSEQRAGEPQASAARQYLAARQALKSGQATGARYVPAQQAVARYVGGVAEQPAAEGVPFDVVNLATAYADALGELDRAQPKYARLKQLQESNAVSVDEVEGARFAVKAAERKVALLHSIAASAIKATEAEAEALGRQLEMLRAQHKAGTDADATLFRIASVEIQLARVQSRLEILKTIVAAR